MADKQSIKEIVSKDLSGNSENGKHGRWSFNLTNVAETRVLSNAPFDHTLHSSTRSIKNLNII